MKTLIICLFIFINSNNIFSQNQEINHLNDLRDNLLKKKKKITDSINIIDIKINNIKSQNKKLEINESNYTTTKTQFEAKIIDEPYSFGNVIGIIPMGESVKVFEFKDGYWFIEKDSIKGYTSEIYLEKNLIMNNLKSGVNNNKIIKKYGDKVGHRIIDHEIWIGMTTDMAKSSIGEPKDINKTVGSWGTHEQWVYENRYLYFENNILTSYQN